LRLWRCIAVVFGLLVAAAPALAAWRPTQDESFDIQLAVPYNLVQPLAWIIHEAGRREGRGRFSSSAFHSRRSPCREGS
jgi:hypothetical protein